MTTVSLARGAVLGGSCGSCFTLSQLEQLLARDEAGVDAAVFAGPDVEVKEPVELADVTDGLEVGRLAWKTNVGLGPADMGLIITGDMLLRKSR